MNRLILILLLLLFSSPLLAIEVDEHKELKETMASLGYEYWNAEAILARSPMSLKERFVYDNERNLHFISLNYYREDMKARYVAHLNMKSDWVIRLACVESLGVLLARAQLLKTKEADEIEDLLRNHQQEESVPTVLETIKQILTPPRYGVADMQSLDYSHVKVPTCTCSRCLGTSKQSINTSPKTPSWFGLEK